jgi:uncharacterized tellurite resistance protein B-like protein
MALKKLVGSLVSIKSADQKENEAIISLAILAMHADLRILEDEVQLVDLVIGQAGLPDRAFVGQLVSKVRSVMSASATGGPATLDAFVGACCREINTPENRRKVLAVFRDIADADHEVSDVEKQISECLGRQFADS